MLGIDRWWKWSHSSKHKSKWRQCRQASIAIHYDIDWILGALVMVVEQKSTIPSITCLKYSINHQQIITGLYLTLTLNMTHYRHTYSLLIVIWSHGTLIATHLWILVLYRVDYCIHHLGRNLSCFPLIECGWSCIMWYLWTSKHQKASLIQ